MLYQEQVGVAMSSYTVNPDELFRAIEQSRKIVNPNKNQSAKDVVIFQGYSGVGKSSLILTLNGQEMVAYHHSISKVPMLMSKAKEGVNGVQISPSIMAGTIYPSRISMSKSASKEKEAVMWDMPGIGQNRGLTQSLINNYYFLRIFELNASVKVALVIAHSDINFAHKGLNLPKVFGDFINIFGDVEKFQQSIMLVITKAPKRFTKKDAIQSFKHIREMPFVKENELIYKLIGKFTSQKIPLMVFQEPAINDTEVYQSNPVNITSQYSSFIKQFYSVVRSLAPSQQLMVKAPVMSQMEQSKCLGFAQKIQKEIDLITHNIGEKLIKYLGNCCPNLNINWKTQEIRQSIAFVASMRNFVLQLSSLVTLPQLGWLQLQDRLRVLNDLFITYSINTLNPYKEEECPDIKTLHSQFIILAYLNHLSFHKITGYDWIDPVKSITNFFQKCSSLNIKTLWQKQVQNLFQNKIRDYVKSTFQNHLKEWQNSDLYLIWKNSFRFFPSFALKLSKFSNSHSRAGKSYVRQYFKEIQLVEDSIKFNSAKIQEICSILNYNKETLDFELDGELVGDTLAPMLDNHQQNLMKAVMCHEKWDANFVTNVLGLYGDIHDYSEAICANQEERPFRRALSKKQKKLACFMHEGKNQNSELGQLEEIAKLSSKVEALQKENQQLNGIKTANDKNNLQLARLVTLQGEFEKVKSQIQQNRSILKKTRIYCFIIIAALLFWIFQQQ